MTECDPAASVEVLKVVLPPLSVPVPSVAVPSLNVTVPVAVDGVTVAVNVTEPPYVDGFDEDVSATEEEDFANIIPVNAKLARMRIRTRDVARVRICPTTS